MIHFILPAMENISGGNIYNDALLKAFKALGRPASIQIVDPNCTVNELEVVPQNQAVFVDSLLLDLLFDLLGQGSKNIHLIAHHLPALEPNADGTFNALSPSEQFVLDNISGVLATSPFMAEWLHENGCKSPTITILPAVRFTPASLPNPSNKVVALMAGNLIPRKGYLPFLQAIINDLKNTDDFVLTIAGRRDMDSSYANQCIKITDQDPRFNFIGPIHADKMPDLYLKHNLFISAAKMETFGMAIDEAKMCGLPLLVLEGGYAGRHVTKCENGHVYDSAEALAGGFLKFIRSQSQFDRLKSSALLAKPDLSERTWKNAALQLENWLKAQI